MTTIIPEADRETYRQMLDDVVPYVEDDDPRRHTHIVNETDNLHIWRSGMGAQDIVDIARVRGIEVTALCGYKWIPQHNPEKYDVCEACMKIAGDIMKEDG